MRFGEKRKYWNFNQNYFIEISKQLNEISLGFWIGRRFALSLSHDDVSQKRRRFGKKTRNFKQNDFIEISK